MSERCEVITTEGGCGQEATLRYWQRPEGRLELYICDSHWELWNNRQETTP
jgi:hypothetical protein